MFPACGPNFNKNELENSCSRDGNFLVRFRRVDIQIEIEFTVIEAYRHTLRTTITGYTRLSRKEERPIDNAFQNKKERRVKYIHRAPDMPDNKYSRSCADVLERRPTSSIHAECAYIYTSAVKCFRETQRK